MTIRQLESKVAYGAAIFAFGGSQSPAIPGQNSKNALDRIADAVEDRLNNYRDEVGLVPLENGEQQILFGREEIIQAAAARVGSFQDLSNAGSGVTLLQEQVPSSLNQTVARIVFHF